MRLINVVTFALEDIDHRFTPYAILSHTWGEQEVTFADMQRGLEHARALRGFKKIRGACRQAASDGFQYIWVDTCCIDKSSSAELSEAINSMFRWYADAEICYAFLSDVAEPSDSLSETNSQFRCSRWFTRGWTLQELLAPEKVVFYSQDWMNLGTKGELTVILSEITRIDLRALTTKDMSRFSVAERMSWASLRTTKRQEDVAYCLLGLFGVNMSLLYGEGDRAFIRLQEEIIKNSDDQSIFVWNWCEVPNTTGGLLATTPLQFRDSKGVVSHQEITQRSSPVLMTNKGLSITLRLSKTPVPDEFMAALNCHYWKQSTNDIVICLRRLASIGDQYARVVQFNWCADRWYHTLRAVSLYVPQVENTTAQVSRAVVARCAKTFALGSFDDFVIVKVVGPDGKELVSLRTANTGFRQEIPTSADGWVAAAIVRDLMSFSTTFWILLSWRRDSGLGIHLMDSYNQTFDADIFRNLDPRQPSSTELKISGKYDQRTGDWNGSGKVFVDTRLQLEINDTALYTLMVMKDF